MPFSKGSSLLREWRGSRNCRTLPIPSEYCICQFDANNVMDVALEEKLGRFFAEKFNRLFLNNGLADKCQMQSYSSVGLL
ncbi:hypothetical protein DICVIV_14410 [Dictyocaulus viviparus]|uniref:Uncharacterized protein n=1 Tax=Dictyocaulus viviparus TaxID=29172 RepID=A0A0D8X5A7_DICVI|nr:hypothetical protein DICVIV_14410 [Dictyocaulus viviparus]